MTDQRERQTGDASYLARVERWEYIQKRLADTPKPTYEIIAKELGIAKQNVARYIKRGTVRPTGRQPSNAGRRQRIMNRLTMWQARRTFKLSKGLDVTFEDGWIADLEGRLKALA
jgi:IS30 family transposase